jgi:hypothetical protein
MCLNYNDRLKQGYIIIKWILLFATCFAQSFRDIFLDKNPFLV